MKNYLLFVIAFLLILFIMPYAQAATVTVSQSGADSGTIMQGNSFIITVSDLSDSGTVTLTDTPAGFSSGEGTLKSFSSGTTSVSWTTAVISQAQSGVKIKAIISIAGSPTTAESSSFNVVLPPSISLSVSPASVSVAKDSTYTVNLNIQNSGGTTANSVALSVSGTGMTKSSGCSAISSIAAGSSSSVSCTVLASSAGTHTVTFTATPSNADSKSQSISATVTGGGGAPGGTTQGPGGAAPPANKTKKYEKKFELVPGVGLRDNLKLQAAIEKVIGKGKLSETALLNLLRLSASIASDTEITKYVESSKNMSNITVKIKYKGDRNVTKFMLYEKIPKSFASSSGSITVFAPGSDYEIIESDPEYVFTYPEMDTNGEAAITFTVNSEVNTSVLDSTASEVYGGVYAGLEEGMICSPREKKCFGSDLRQCSDDGKSWATIRTCDSGCSNGECNPSAGGAQFDFQSFMQTAIFYLPFIVMLAAVLVIITASLVVRRRRKKRKLPLPKPVPEMKMRPDLPT